MNLKAKGTNAERELIHLFWSKGWAAVRVAGSGSSSYPNPDILAGNKLRRFAVECKVTGEDKKYLSEGDLLQLKNFCDTFGAEPLFAVKLNRGGKWLFLIPEDLEKTAKGYVISSETASRRGVSFEELIEFTL